MRTLSKVTVVLVSLAVLTAGTAFIGGTFAQGPDHGANGSDNANSNSEADITVTYYENCTAFHVESSKDISFVSINNETTHTYHKFEGSDIRTEDEDRDGDDPNGQDLTDFSHSQDEEIKSIVVKSGSTMEVFNCPDSGSGEVDADPEEEPECDDGEDNDGDNATDHPADPGCETPDDDDERDPADGGGGDDGDGNETDDSDDDGVPDEEDNCPDVENPNQTDTDGDGEGDACDDDDDGDGVNDNNDNCPLTQNKDQVDTDDDGEGDACDDDDDGDSVNDGADNCPTTANPDQADADQDGVGDACEFAVETENATNITNTSATLNGNLTNLGDNDNATVRFQWRKNATESWNETDNQTLTEVGEFSANLTNLASNTTYEFRAIAESGDDEDQGEILTFTTQGAAQVGTCEEGGAFQENTVANEVFGTENEEGPISSQIHDNEEQFQDLEPVVHEGSCVVATVDNNAG